MTRNLPSLVNLYNRYDPFSVGHHDLFSQLENLAEMNTNFPRYNIDHYENDVTKISVALAGYDEKELEVSVEDSTLKISGKVELEANGEAAHRGIAHRSFTQSFVLGKHIEVKDATFKNGLLVITLQKVVPEHAKLKTIKIN